MNILVLGAGMYVTGRGTNGLGTLLPAIAQVSRSRKVDTVTVVAGNPANGEIVARCAEELNRKLGAQVRVLYRAVNLDAPESELDSILKDQPMDAAVVSTPDDTHFPLVSYLLQKKLPTLVVKPFVTSLADAERLVELQESSGVWGAVEFHKRFDESNLYAKKVVAEGSLGELLYFTVDYSQRISIPTEVFAGWADRTNIFQYLAVHYVDLIFFLTGFLPTRLTVKATRKELVSRGINTPDSMHVMLEWQSKDDGEMISMFNCNWIDPETTSAMSDQSFKIVGTRGRLECEQKNRGIELVTGSGGVQHLNPYFSEYLPGPDKDWVFQGYGFESVRQFFDDVAAIQDGGQTIGSLSSVRPSFRQSLVSQAVVDTVNKALTGPPGWHDVPAVDPGTPVPLS